MLQAFQLVGKSSSVSGLSCGHIISTPEGVTEPPIPESTDWPRQHTAISPASANTSFSVMNWSSRPC
jgi:hypothetical protein